MFCFLEYLVEMKCLENKLLILRPTQPIGSTRKVKEIIRKSTGFNEGKDYFLAYMPERILEGSALEEEESLPKIIGTFNEKSFEVANNLVSKLGGQIKKVSSPEVAEFVKLLDNSWRHTRFAFANDAALAAENVGIDVTEAINAANFEYPRNSIAKPGPVSGYCLGKDPYIFEYSFRKTELLRNFNSLWYQSIQSSKYLLDHIISQVTGKNVLLMGLSFKKDIDDYRLSHGVFLLKKLVDKGFLVTVIDENFESNDYTKLSSNLKKSLKIKKNISELESSSHFDTVIISIDNKEYSNIQSFLLKHDKIVDLWGMFKNERQRFKNYWALGLGNI